MADATGSVHKNTLCIKMEFTGNQVMELIEDMSPCVRSTSGRSVPVILFGSDDDDVNNFKLMMYYSF